jgi:parallel beta-helix repeat protein
VEKEIMTVGTILCCCVLTFAAVSAAGAGMIRADVSSAAELQALLAEPVDSMEIFVATGHYHLDPREIVDSTCGNCPDPDQAVPATAGLVISGNYVRLFGPEGRWAVIHTHAGYGLFFDHCRQGIVENLFITDGVRDPDPNATDAAIAVKNSAVTIRGNRIHGNIGDSTLVTGNIVGIMGICGRENARLTVEDNEIRRNSWDGIALYRGAEAVIRGNLIDGVDRAPAGQAGGGRGVAIGVTWDARAVIEDNLLRRYWKGLGIFVDARVTARGNIIEEMRTWGLALWDADAGAPAGIIEDNAIYRTGACGVTITRSRPGPAPGRLTGNVIVETAQDPRYDDPDLYCHQCALSIFSRPDNFIIEDNLFFNNRTASPDLPNDDLSPETFGDLAAGVADRLLTSPLLQQSDFARFLAEY